MPPCSFSVTAPESGLTVAEPGPTDQLPALRPRYQERAVRSRLSQASSAVSPRRNQPEEVPPAQAMAEAQAALDEHLAAALLTRLQQAPPEFFERSVLRLLLALGYGRNDTAAVRWSGGRDDGGIDGAIDLDALGLDRLCVQAKRFGEGVLVGSHIVRDFFGALDRAKAGKGVIATTSLFTSGARLTAATLSKPIVLLDGPALVRLMIRHGVGCRVAASYRVMALDEGFFAERAA